MSAYLGRDFPFIVAHIFIFPLSLRRPERASVRFLFMSRERRFFGEAIIRIAHDEPREGCFLSDTVTRISKAVTDAQATIQTMHRAFNGCACGAWADPRGGRNSTGTTALAAFSGSRSKSLDSPGRRALAQSHAQVCRAAIPHSRARLTARSSAVLCCRDARAPTG